MPRTNAILDLATLVADAAALSESLLAGDIDEARFRARLTESAAAASGLRTVRLAAHDVVLRLGAPGQLPMPGYAAAVLELADVLDDASTALYF